MSPEETPDRGRIWTRLRLLLRNPISMAGVALALVSIANIFLFVLIDLIAQRPSPYIGILAYVIAPGFLICGLLLTFAGAWRQRRRISAGQPIGAQYPRIDLNDAAQRSAIVSFSVFLLIFVMVSSAGSYKAYEYTESVQFCGQTCHTPMHPEYTAYQVSPHARVGCVECHVGAGASWYLRSKLSGARQLVTATLNTFPRPIPTPVHNLRPASDTCEQCHWPNKFYGEQLKVFTHYASDEQNTVRRIGLLLKTGGGDPAIGTPQGIHWHMNISNEIDYVADEKREVISYIHVKDPEGRVTEYFSQDPAINNEQIARAPRRRMDCVDCHNRPAHVYVPPDQAIDEAMLARRLDAGLPYIKQQAVAALTGKYETTDSAMQGIAQGMEGFYESKYSELAKSKGLEIRNAIEEVQRIFRRTTFPEMKLNWQTHPNNLGHMYFNGCFRCHDGQHVSREGKVISKDCDSCHTVLGQQEGTASISAAEKKTFQHPVDLGDLTQVSCSDCHTGGTSP